MQERPPGNCTVCGRSGARTLDPRAEMVRLAGLSVDKNQPIHCLFEGIYGYGLTHVGEQKRGLDLLEQNMERLQNFPSLYEVLQDYRRRAGVSRNP